MKHTLLVLMLMSQAALLSAQETNKKIPAERKNEIGTFSHFNPTSSGFNDMGLMGVQYKHWKNETIGYRIIGAWGNYYNYSHPFSTHALSDTVVEKSTETRIDLAIIGAGVEAQRKFYKRIYLFAAVELRGGYGTGTNDTITVKRLNNAIGNYHYAGWGNRTDASMFYLNISPSIGAKFNFNRISFGMEVFAVNMGIQSIKYGNGPSHGISDLDMGNISQRMFINFRF